MPLTVDYEKDQERSTDEGGEHVDERRLKIELSSTRRVNAGADRVGHRVDAHKPVLIFGGALDYRKVEIV